MGLSFRPLGLGLSFDMGVTVGAPTLEGIMGIRFPLSRYTTGTRWGVHLKDVCRVSMASTVICCKICKELRVQLSLGPRPLIGTTWDHILPTGSYHKGRW